MIRGIVAGITLILVALAISARAHDPYGRWEDWFLVQKNMRGASCCDISHAHYLQEKDWRSDGEHYQVRVFDQWFDIEDWQMLKRVQPNPTGRAILWYSPPLDEGGFLILCFTPSHET